MIAGVVVALVLAQAQPPAPAGGAPLLTLRQALAEARQRNLDLKQAEARLKQSNELSAKAWSYYLPQVSAGGAYTRNNLGAVIEVPVGYYVVPTPAGAPAPYQTGEPSSVYQAVVQLQDQFTAQVQLKQAIIAPALWPAISNAYKAERMAALTTENARREILFGVAQAYYGVAALAAALEVSERQLAITRDQEKDASVRYRAGAIPKVALLRAQIDRARAEEDLKRAQNALASGKLGLATLLDRPSADFEVEVPAEPQVPTDTGQLEQGALRDRPDVEAARVGVDLAEGQRTGVWAQYLPSLGGFAQLTWANFVGFTGRETNWAVGLALNWNILDGGLREAQLRESAARVIEAGAARQSAEAKALEDVRRALLDLDSARANRAKAKEQADLARENQRLVEVNFKAGAATYIEVADATTQLRSAELNYVAESLSADLAAIALLKASGIHEPAWAG